MSASGPVEDALVAGPGTALSLDATGTLILLREPLGITYARIGRRFGVSRSPDAIDAGLRTALRGASPALRASPDRRALWRHVVSEATGSADPDLFETLYALYATATPWRLAPGARACCEAVRRRGMAVAVVSNWDSRLRGVLDALGADFVDLVVISAEEGVDKPDPRLYARAVDRLGVAADHVVHVGDDPVRDGEAARRAGLRAWVLGIDVADLDEVRVRLTRDRAGP